ncbi:MAG: bifunctional alpha,alpha-trehalose-phosphate synthase (UDP-forming)/trehalose-phosphatase [Firmicutes bacterium]|nr:bifunctional alpha,alpha-trehalose-phosphate synthase (UDP-forming)/trehalose-phosphatase [Bacillota bacterium]
MDKNDKSKPSNRVIIVSNRLPVSVARNNGNLNITPSVGGLATGLSSFHRDSNGLWVGWPGVDPVNSEEKKAMENTLRNDFSCLPVYLSAYDLKKYYYGFSNRTLWPLFHYFTTYSTYEKSEWKAYRKVNQLFCSRLLEVLEPGDIVWVHDYHLLLLPDMLRQENVDNAIGLFLHIPFPSMEIFRYLPWREEILRGMLGADLIGFHTYDYTRHFLSCVLRILGREQEYGQVVAGNRLVKADTFPMGIDARKYSDAVNLPSVISEKETLRDKLKTEKIILSVDRLDFSKGIPERLRAFELFLEKYPKWRNKITFIMLCVPSRTKVEQYQLLKREIDELVGRINGRFARPGWLPILYMYRSVPFNELIALYSEADLALVTPLRDGMNLVAKEYLACHSKMGNGALVLSETAGAAAELGEAIIVNPNDMEMIADAIAQGLDMTLTEKKAAISFMSRRIEKYDIFRWAEDFIEHLSHIRGLHDLNKQRFLNKDLQGVMRDSYKKAEKRLILLDYDGTLVSLKKKPELAKPPAELLHLLSNIKGDPKNTVVIISGRDRECLSEWMGESGVDLVAEHGTWLFEADLDKWWIKEEGLAEEWKKNFYPILEMFSERTPGSFVEEKTYALVWHYRKAEPELGDHRAKELMDALHDMLSGTALQVLRGSKVVEIKPAGVNKGKAAMYWLGKEKKWDFILAMGDDWTDEDIFAVVPENTWSIRVGFKPYTKANYFMESPVEVISLLRSLADIKD